MGTTRVLVVGAGAAGSAAATVLAQAAAELEVVIVGAEDRLPYNRTTVNKGLLSGAVDDAGIALPGMDLPGVTWRLGERVVHLDPVNRSVRLAGGEQLSADAVVLAVGARPRRLPVEAPDGNQLLTLRSADDTARLRGQLTSGAPVLVVGAGLIGTETSGVLRQAGQPVVLVDAAATPMAPLVGPTVAEWILREHRAAGIDVRAGTTVQSLSPRADNSLSVTLSDGTQLTSAVVLTALGVTPDTDWLAGSGVLGDALAGAVAVDGQQRVIGRPGLYAAGDAAAVPGPDGRPVRIEHWGAALAQGRAAARTVLADLGAGGPEEHLPAIELPSYSTYVHDTKLTILGWPQLATQEVPLLGRPGDDRFAVALHDQQQRLVGAVGVGGARAVNQIKDLLQRRAPVEELATLQAVTR
jgi:3-phenylpropionate/trans-cinnamate dioxygenase ferredoxin reductase component